MITAVIDGLVQEAVSTGHLITEDSSDRIQTTLDHEYMHSEMDEPTYERYCKALDFLTKYD